MRLLLLALLVRQEAADPGRAAVESAAATLKDSKSIAYTFEWTRVSAEETIKAEVKVALRRPGRALFAMSERKKKKTDTYLHLLDGKDYWGFNEKRTQYVTDPQESTAHSFAFDPVLSLFQDRSAAPLLALAADLTTGREGLKDEMCTTVGWKVKYSAGMEWRIWINEKGLLRKVQKTVDGALHERLEYGAFDLSPSLVDKTFVFTPAKDARCLRSGVDDQAALLAVGVQAPDFEASDLEGKTVRLSDFKGQAVLLHFWEFS